MAFDRFDFEVDDEGPRFSLGVWRRKPKPKSLAERIADETKALDIRRTAADLAAARIPVVDSEQPCSFEQRIRAGFQAIVDEEADRARAALDMNGAELAALGTDLIDSTYRSNEARLDGQLATIETDLAATLPGPMRNYVECETRLNQFNEKNGTANEPVARSTFLWLATTIATSIIEGMLNTALFRNELGVGPGGQFAIIVGLAFGCIGTLAGIGASQLKRTSPVRRFIGGLVLAAAVVVGVVFLMKIGEYRTSLGDPESALSGFAALLRPELAPYAIINLAGILFVAWKAVPVFAYRDLKRLREQHAEAGEMVAGIIAQALNDCETERTTARKEAEGIAVTAQANAARAHDLAACENIVEGLDSAIERLSDAVVGCEQEFREVVMRVHPEGGSHDRFKVPPARFAGVTLPIDPRFAVIANALEARSVTMRDDLPDALACIDKAANDAKDRVGEKVVEIEAEARSSRGATHNVFRFKRAGVAA